LLGAWLRSLYWACAHDCLANAAGAASGFADDGPAVNAAAATIAARIAMPAVRRILIT
jgi:hypothetical protein